MDRAAFKIPAGCVGRFAVVKLWPKIKAAEDENVARLKVTAKSLGLECVEIAPDGRLLDPPHQRLTQADVDFVIHLHFETPKAYDIFSFVALWNPVQFYHDWGYRRFSRHLLTHDDFLSCSATWTDDHVRRMIASDPTRVPAAFTLYHSLSEPIHEPTLGDRKIFYAGVNWERLGKKKGRHQELLNLLDPTGDLRIFGPRIFQGVNVWEGYQSYSGPIPFDGVSILSEINKSGIALVLSSDAHKQSELMSNRLFEGLAGGAFIICDENPFARRHFGETLLYIDARQPTDDVCKTVLRHVQWIKEHPEQALAMAREAQAIFRRQFSLDQSVVHLYEGLSERRRQLERLYAPADASRPVTLFMLMPRFDPAVLARHLASAKTQRYPNCRPVLLVDPLELEENGNAIRAAIAAAGVALEVRGVSFFERDPAGRVRKSVRLGEIFNEAIRGLPAADALFAFVAPDEELFAEHVQSLVGALARNPEAGVAISNALYRHASDGTTFHDLQDELDYVGYATHRPLGYGRFLFRRSAFADSIDSALRYLDVKAMALLVAACAKRVASRRASVTCDIQSAFNLGFQPNLQFEHEVMRDYLPALLTVASTHGVNGAAVLQQEELEPTSLSLKRLSESNRQTIAVELAHSVPIPSAIKKVLFGGYRMWLRRSR